MPFVDWVLNLCISAMGCCLALVCFLMVLWAAAYSIYTFWLGCLWLKGEIRSTRLQAIREEQDLRVKFDAWCCREESRYKERLKR